MCVLFLGFLCYLRVSPCYVILDYYFLFQTGIFFLFSLENSKSFAEFDLLEFLVIAFGLVININHLELIEFVLVPLSIPRFFLRVFGF